jgi:hypothetical protein
MGSPAFWLCQMAAVSGANARAMWSRLKKACTEQEYGRSATQPHGSSGVRLRGATPGHRPPSLGTTHLGRHRPQVGERFPDDLGELLF